jgi:hypothetical protein
MHALPTWQAPDARVTRRAGVDCGERERGITGPPRGLARTAQGAPLGQDASNRVLDLTVGTLFHPVVFGPDTPDRDVPHDRPTSDVVCKRFAGARAQQAQCLCRHRPLHPKEEAIMELTGIINAVIIQEHGLGARPEVQHMMPVPAVACQA